MQNCSRTFSRRFNFNIGRLTPSTVGITREAFLRTSFGGDRDRMLARFDFMTQGPRVGLSKLRAEKENE
jgi:hypothetical protein